MKVRAFYSIIICLILGSLSHAQENKIWGFVTDSDMKPLNGISIHIQEINQTINTDENGRYEFKHLNDGFYTLVVDATNYLKESKAINLVKNQSEQIDFILRNDVIQLQTVEILGRNKISYMNDESFASTKTSTLIKDTPQTISYVTKEVMADRQAYRVNDVVKNISGVNQYSFYNDYTIRGFRSEQELINGLRVIGLFGPQILTANLERVEVIKGPSSAVFGNSSPGGTMNRVTKKPLATDRKALSFTTGSYNTLRATADFTGPLNESKTLLYRLNMAYENSDNFRDLQKFKSFMVAPSVTFLPTDKTKINFDLVLTNFDGKLDRGQPIFGASSGTDLNSTPISLAIGAANDYHKTNVAYSTLSLSHQFTDRLSFNSSYMMYSYNEDLFEHRTSNRFAVDSLGNQIPTLMGMRISAREQQETTHNVTSYFVYDFKTGGINHKLLAGYDFVNRSRPVGGGIIFTSSSAIYRTIDGGLAKYDPANASNFIFENGLPKPNIPHFDLKNPTYKLGYPSDYILNRRERSAYKLYTQGIYFQDQIKYKNLQVLLGLRQEYYTDVLNYKKENEETISQNKLLPRIGMVYTLNPQINIYGTYTQSFQPQQASTLDEASGGPFDPKTGKMVEFGFKSTFFHDKLATNVSFYNIDYKNILVTDADTGLLKQRGAERSRGFEVDVNGSISKNFMLTANYAYNKGTIEESDEPELIGELKSNAPLHAGGFFANYEVLTGTLRNVNFNLGSNFVTERNTNDKGLTLPACLIFDGGVSYKINKVKLALTVNNILNKKHWVGGYSYVRLFPGAPRNYLLNIAYTF
ncbi:MAG: TonB-dependent siderophore receptor [Weeksellaceae bacterium]